MNNNAPLQVLKLRVEADFLEASHNFTENPNMDTLNRLADAKKRKELFDSIVTPSEFKKNEPTN